MVSVTNELIMLSVIMLDVVMLNVIMLNVIMPSVWHPFKLQKKLDYISCHLLPLGYLGPVFENFLQP